MGNPLTYTHFETFWSPPPEPIERQLENDMFDLEASTFPSTYIPPPYREVAVTKSSKPDIRTLPHEKMDPPRFTALQPRKVAAPEGNWTKSSFASVTWSPWRPSITPPPRSELQFWTVNRPLTCWNCFSTNTPPAKGVARNCPLADYPVLEAPREHIKFNSSSVFPWALAKGRCVKAWGGPECLATGAAPCTWELPVVPHKAAAEVSRIENL